MRVPFVDLRREYHGYRRELEEAFSGVLDSAAFILGREVESFESEFASFCGCAGAVGVASGTDALMLALKVCGVVARDQVITAANTFIATFDAIERCGATPVPVDPDPVYYTIEPEATAHAVTGSTSAVVPVHLYGQPADVPAIKEACRGLAVIEDAAQAHGAVWGERRAGSFGTCGCFSFYPSKNLGALGDGGAVVTDDGELEKRLRGLRNYGQERKNEHLEVGYNSRLDEVQAAALRVRLRRLVENNELRRKAAARYSESLRGVDGIVPPAERPGASHVYHLFVVTCEERDDLRRHLDERGISTGVHYPTAPHLQQAYRHLGYGPGSFPVAERLSSQVLSLPMFPYITTEEIDYTCESIASFFGA